MLYFYRTNQAHYLLLLNYPGAYRTKNEPPRHMLYYYWTTQAHAVLIQSYPGTCCTNIELPRHKRYSTHFIPFTFHRLPSTLIVRMRHIILTAGLCLLIAEFWMCCTTTELTRHMLYSYWTTQAQTVLLLNYPSTDCTTTELPKHRLYYYWTTQAHVVLLLSYPGTCSTSTELSRPMMYY